MKSFESKIFSLMIFLEKKCLKYSGRRVRLLPQIKLIVSLPVKRQR